MPQIALTHVTLNALKAESRTDFWDSATPCFGVRVGKDSKTFIAKVGNRRHTIGRFPAISLQDARKKALALKAAPHTQSTLTFTEARERFLKIHGATLRPRSLYQTRRTLTRHFTWTKPLDKITHAHVAEAIEAITAPSEAAHAFKDIRTFFNWCVPKYIPHSPCTGLKTPHRYIPRDRLLTDEEIHAIWLASFKVGAYGLQVRRLITTGQRANQCFSLRPAWVTEGLIVFPASIMKGNREHRLPYGPLTKTLLTDFPSVTNQGKFKALLDAHSGVENSTLHDFRRYFSSTHARLKTPIDITEALLSHVSGSRSPIQRVYDHYDRLEEKKQAVVKYEAHLVELFRS